MTDDEIRLFNEIMGQPGGEIEGLATSFPSIFEVPSITKDDALTSQVKDMIRKAAAEREAKRQADFASRPFSEKVKGAGEAASFLGSAVGRSMAEPFVELYGEATGRKGLGKEFVEAGFTPDKLPKTDLGLEYTVRTGEALEPVGEALEASKLPHGPFMPELVPLFSIPAFANKISLKTAGDSVVQDASKAAKVAQQSLGKAAEAVREEFATPPVGAIAPDALGFSSRLSESVDKLQDKGTGPQFLAQLKKMKGVPQKEIEATGLDKYLQGAGKVTKEDVQEFLSTNRLEIIEDERVAGAAKLTERELNTLPREFDWLDRYDLNEDFEDKAHLRNHLMVTLNRHFDDLEADAADKGGFYARDTTGELRYIPESRKFEWLEAEQDRIDDVLSEFPDFNSNTNFADQYLIAGGKNYREILYKLPDDKVEGVFRPPPSHYTNAENTFGSIRATDRDIDGKPVLFAEEIQSDWAIKGAKEGYRPKDFKTIKGKVVEQDGPGAILTWKVEWDDGTFSGGYDQETAEEVARLGKRAPGVPDNPFRGNWYKPVINNFLVKAAKEGKQGIGFPTGQIIADRYNLSKAVDAIEWNTYAYKSGNKYKTVVFRNFGDQGVIEVDVNPETGVIKEVSSDLDRTPDWENKNIVDVVGKGVAEKIMGDKSGLLDEEGLKVGGKGKDKLYDEMIPKQLKEIGDKYGVQLEKRTIPFGEDYRTESEVYFFPITEEMRADLLNQGLPMFAEGGHVQKYAKGGKVLQGVAKGAKQAVKNLSKKDLQAIGSELETSTGRLADIAKKYPQIKDISVSEMEQFSAGDPFTTYRGISLFPGAELRSEVIPSTTIEPGIATNILRDAPVIMGRQEFVSPKGVLRRYPGVRPSDVEVYVPSMIESITERQPGALELKIPTRSGGKMSLKDIFDEVRREKEVLADVSGKQPIDITFDKYGGGMMDRMFMSIARDVFSGKWEGGENFLKEMGGYYTDPQGMIKEFDEFAASIAPVKKSKGGILKKAAEGARRAEKGKLKALSNVVNKRMANGGAAGNRFAEMAKNDQLAQDQVVGDVNRQLSELIARYKNGDPGVREKDLLLYFPGYTEYDIANMYGTTTESANPLMSEKIQPFTPEMIPGLQRRGEAVQSDFDRMIREGRLLDPMNPKKVMELAKGGALKAVSKGAKQASAEVKKTGKIARLQKELLERGGPKQAQRLERAADEIPGLERLFHTRGLIEAFQGNQGYPYQGVVTMKPGDYKNWANLLEVQLNDGRTGISPYSVQNIEDLRELIQRGRPFTSVPYLQLERRGPLTIVSGHEGRHRTRAMEAEDIPATLVTISPRRNLKFDDSRGKLPEEWRSMLRESMGPEGLVLPESGMKKNPKLIRAGQAFEKAAEEKDYSKKGAIDREMSRYYNEGIAVLPDLEMLTEFPEVYQKGGSVVSAMTKGAKKASDQIKGQKMLQGVYRGYTGERLAEPVLSTTPQKRVAEYYANRRAAERGEDPHLEMLMVDPFAGKQYGLSLPIDQYNRNFITTRARAITPEDVAERIQLKKRGGLASLSR